MNYIIEGNINFFDELNKEVDDTDFLKKEDDGDMKICTISHMPLTYNFIKLPCNHSFNYLPLYNELTLTNTYKRSIKCPYCRTLSSKLIPYIPLPGVEKKYGINTPKKLCMDSPKCLYKLKNGKNKGVACGKDGIETSNGTFCKLHNNLNSSTITKKKSTPTIIWTTEKEDLFKRKSVVQLKQLLKEKGMKTNGLKKELVNRVFIYNNANSENNANELISLL